MGLIQSILDILCHFFPYQFYQFYQFYQYYQFFFFFFLFLFLFHFHFLIVYYFFLSFLSTSSTISASFNFFFFFSSTRDSCGPNRKICLQFYFGTPNGFSTDYSQVGIGNFRFRYRFWSVTSLRLNTVAVT